MDTNLQPNQKIGFALYFKKLLFPLCAELLFILSYILWPEKVLYFDVVYCIIIVIYFRKLFSFRKWAGFFRLRQFWIAVGITAALTYLIHKLTGLLSFREIIGIPDGNISTMIPSSTTLAGSLFNMLLYTLITVILPPFVETLFYRRAMIRFETKWLVYATAAAGMILCSLNYALGLPGIVEGVIVSLPLTIVYLMTRNIYIPITAQLIVGLLRFTYPIIYDIARIITR
ncbi:MAG: hypothetical protein J6P87_05965 [Lachnospiraceae bacterium]|nr:hypothetical protein [Lachnospiraceae bacterium]